MSGVSQSKTEKSGMNRKEFIESYLSNCGLRREATIPGVDMLVCDVINLEIQRL